MKALTHLGAVAEKDAVPQMVDASQKGLHELNRKHKIVMLGANGIGKSMLCNVLLQPSTEDAITYQTAGYVGPKYELEGEALARRAEPELELLTDSDSFALQDAERPPISNFEAISDFCNTKTLPADFESFLVTSRDAGASESTGKPTTQHPIEFHHGRVPHIVVAFHDQTWAAQVIQLGDAPVSLSDGEGKAIRELAGHLQKLSSDLLQKYAGKATLLRRPRAAGAPTSLVEDLQYVRRILNWLTAEDSGQPLGALAKEIHVFIPSHLLQHGGSLIDAPGTNDSSAAREARLKTALDEANVVLMLLNGALDRDASTLKILKESEAFKSLVSGTATQIRLIVVQNPERHHETRLSLQECLSKMESGEASKDYQASTQTIREELMSAAYEILQETDSGMSDAEIQRKIQDILAHQVDIFPVYPTLALSALFNHDCLRAAYQESPFVDKALEHTGLARLSGAIETIAIQQACAVTCPILQALLETAVVAPQPDSPQAPVGALPTATAQLVEELEKKWAVSEPGGKRRGKRRGKGESPKFSHNLKAVKGVQTSIVQLKEEVKSRASPKPEIPEDPQIMQWFLAALSKYVVAEPTNVRKGAQLGLPPKPTPAFITKTFINKSGSVGRTNPLRYGAVVREVLSLPDSPLRKLIGINLAEQHKVLEETAKKMRDALQRDWLGTTELPEIAVAGLESFEVQACKFLKQSVGAEVQILRDVTEYVLASVIKYQNIRDDMCAQLESASGHFDTGLRAVRTILVPALAAAMAAGCSAAAMRVWRFFDKGGRVEKLSNKGTWASPNCALRAEVMKLRMAMIAAFKNPDACATAARPTLGAEAVSAAQDALKLLERWRKSAVKQCVAAGTAQLERFRTRGLVLEELCSVDCQPAQFAPQANLLKQQPRWLRDLEETTWSEVVNGRSDPEGLGAVLRRGNLFASTEPAWKADQCSLLTQVLKGSKAVQLAASLLRGWATNAMERRLAASLRQALLLYVRNGYGLTKETRDQFESKYGTDFDEWMGTQSDDAKAPGDRVLLQAFADFARVDVHVIAADLNGQIKRVSIVSASENSRGLVLVAYSAQAGFMFVEKNKHQKPNDHSHEAAAAASAAETASIPIPIISFSPSPPATGSKTLLVVDTCVLLTEGMWNTVKVATERLPAIVVLPYRVHQELTIKKNDPVVGFQARRILDVLKTSTIPWAIQTYAHSVELQQIAGRLGGVERTAWGDLQIVRFTKELEMRERRVLLVTADKDFAGLAKSHELQNEPVFLEQLGSKTSRKIQSSVQQSNDAALFAAIDKVSCILKRKSDVEEQQQPPKRARR
eukprot:TRINITY_DN7791_c0_g4_i1.p1 TRINITY_DN7791_c0_g4~~TRINITY_DN7791_c0_g4_i1.p1  ORF type:complete len:1311 (+),score=294.88 TRINITY_DN7791_c0_g4_i1:173-4105(+)